MAGWEEEHKLFTGRRGKSPRQSRDPGQRSLKRAALETGLVDSKPLAGRVCVCARAPVCV